MKKDNLLWIAAVKRIFKWCGISLIIIVLLLLAVILTARAINADKYKIKTENGIQESTYVELGGIKQYLQIRGEDAKNPIIIFLHGGPGSPMAYVSYYYQTELESDYTIVNWDQRGCGRTYYANPDMNIETELSTDILLSDLDELTDYLMKRFGQDKVVIMGHSWGTILGSMYAKEHPEKVSAYIGIGQAINYKEGMILASNKAIEYATKEGNTKDAEKLSAELSKYTKTKNYKDLDWKNFVGIAGLNQKYLTYEGKMPFLQQSWIGLSSPHVSLDDLRWFITLMNMEKSSMLEAPLIEELFFKLDINEQSKEYKVPTYFISGDSDWITPRVMVLEYYKQVEATDKEMIVIKNAGHSPFMDDPYAFCAVVKKVLSNINPKQ